MKYTHEIVGTHGGALLPKRAPGACSGRKIPRVYRPLQICHFTARPSYVKFFLANKGLSWDNSILIEERKTLKSSILVIHVHLKDRVKLR